ncbi:MAG: type II CAAX endopeptidase family protein [Pseudomonadota bacterium]
MALNALRARADRHPQTTAIAIIGLFVLFILAPVLLLGPEDTTGGTGTLNFETLTSGLPLQIIVSAVLLLIVGVLGWWRMTLLWSRLERRGLRALYFTLAYPLLGIVVITLVLNDGETGRNPRDVLLLVLVLNFFVGLSEELLFRGILFGALRQKNRLITAIVVSSIAFGLLHVVNAGVGQSADQTLFQVINAASLGVLFCALTLTTNNLWPAIMLHMVWNSYAMMGLASTEVMPESPETALTPTDLSAWAFLVPTLILLIGIAILYGYRHASQVRLRDVVPPPGLRKDITDATAPR